MQNIQASKNRLSVFCQQPFEKSQEKTGAFIRARDNRILPNSRKLKIPQQFITHKFSNLTWEYHPTPFRACKVVKKGIQVVQFDGYWFSLSVVATLVFKILSGFTFLKLLGENRKNPKSESKLVVWCRKTVKTAQNLSPLDN
jgi:hypothetical protein